MKSNEIRSTFLNFFENNDHKVLKSSSLVPSNDPTLMFTNAGMVQFKNVFTGMEDIGFKRAVTSQKCLRAGGKHNDLENVGYTARHHTFFEMLGNFSFGDYFKEYAIEQSWDFITKELSLPKEKLLVTVYHEDTDARNLWKKISGLSDDNIISIKTSDNFWSMGEVGPCGPCSEIFYDHGDKIFGGPPGSANEDGDRFVEIWNLVFMQYEQKKSCRINLPNPSIDTGMGLERMAAILQGKTDNYQIDTFKGIMNCASSLLSCDLESNSLKVVADHIRACAFLIADGILPSNEGRGYVLRRIIRRAVRHINLLGAKEPLLHKIFKSVQKEMGSHYNELNVYEKLIENTIYNEEAAFIKTLSRGMKILNNEIEKIGSKKIFDGSIAFTLFDTYGFPLDLTADVLRKYKKIVDVKSFDEAMKKQKELARKSWKGTGDLKDSEDLFKIKKKVQNTKFLGYETLDSQGEVVAILKNNAIVDKAYLCDDGEFIIITDKTPFYAEMGGQVGDAGILYNNEFSCDVIDVKKALDGLFLHFVKVTKGEIIKATKINMQVNAKRRKNIAKNHSATHLMLETLRRKFGNHITQKGSYQNDKITRFDFSHPSKILKNDLNEIEINVNKQIIGNSKVETLIMSPKDAEKKGAIAQFGEKYGDSARVVLMGDNDINNKSHYSIELCGGTHVKRLGEIGSFKIISESAIGSGIRRIEALCGENAIKYNLDNEVIVDDLQIILSTKKDEILNKINALQQSLKDSQKQIKDFKKKALLEDGENNENIETINNTKFITRTLEIPAKDMMPLVDNYKQKIEDDFIVLLFSTMNNKVSILIASNSDKYNCVELVKMASPILGGKGGGGRPNMAQAGGADKSKINDVIKLIKEQI